MPLAALAATAALLLALAFAPASVGAVRPGAAAAAAALRPDAPKQPPRVPASYSVNYTLSLPYTASIPGQPLLSYPVAFHVDTSAGRVRMDLYPGDAAGQTSMIQRKGALFEVVPRYDRQVRPGWADRGGFAKRPAGCAAAAATAPTPRAAPAPPCTPRSAWRLPTRRRAALTPPRCPTCRRVGPTAGRRSWAASRWTCGRTRPGQQGGARAVHWRGGGSGGSQWPQKPGAGCTHQEIPCPAHHWHVQA